MALALFEWIPCVIQAVKPWMSEEIAKGARWSPEIAKELEETRFGIICLTADNLTAPWILFETGALAKTVERTYVCPYLLAMKPSDIDGPLAQFQAAVAERADTLKLLKSINAAQAERALPVGSIESQFDMWWPRLETELQAATEQPVTKPSKRTEMELLEEILQIVRQLDRENNIVHKLDFEKNVDANTRISTLLAGLPSATPLPDEFWSAWRRIKKGDSEKK